MPLYNPGAQRPGMGVPGQGGNRSQTAAQRFQAAIRGRPAQPVTPPPMTQKIDALKAQTDRGRLAQRLMPQPAQRPGPMLPRLPQMAAPAPMPVQQPAVQAPMLPAPSQAPLPVPEPAPQMSIQDTSIGQTPSINNPTPDVTDGGSILGGPAAYPRYSEQDLQASIDAGKVNQPVTVPNIGTTTPEDLYKQYQPVFGDQSAIIGDPVRPMIDQGIIPPGGSNLLAPPTLDRMGGIAIGLPSYKRPVPGQPGLSIGW